MCSITAGQTLKRKKNTKNFQFCYGNLKKNLIFNLVYFFRVTRVTLLTKVHFLASFHNCLKLNSSEKHGFFSTLKNLQITENTQKIAYRINMSQQATWLRVLLYDITLID